MARKIELDPVTRLEGHYAVRLEVENGRVARAFSSGEMFRGFEQILRGRHPMDAQQITQRICGVCPISHGMASVLAQDEAYGLKTVGNGRILRNLILGANYIQSHIVHFYQLSALDFVDITAVLKYQGKDPQLNHLKNWADSQLKSNQVFPVAPFLPRYEGKYLEDTELNLGAIHHYLQALEMRALAHRMVALFGGKAPHATALIPGGITEIATARNIASYGSMLDKLRGFIDNVYLPDIMAVAPAFPEYFSIGRGCGNFLAYGVFAQDDSGGEKLFAPGVLRRGKLEELNPERITEDVGHSLFSSSSGLHPYQGQTVPSPDKSGAYTWLKAPRYDGEVFEVGPLARMLVAYHQGDEAVKTLVDGVLKTLNAGPEALVSVLGRHAARALECKLVADSCAKWLKELKPGTASSLDFKIPNQGRGQGLTEAPRGALGHWIAIKEGKIANYQCVVPSTWNCSPRDDQGNPGPVEQALTGLEVADENHPIEAARVIRSFDPCLACAVH
jgi:Ni,Fe-hydrogenase I large subunit